MEVRNHKTYKYAPYIVTEDEEANKVYQYGELKDIKAYIYPATGQVQAQQYGEDMNYILNLLTNENTLREGYGIAYNSETINYKVISIKTYTNHFLCEVKKI